MDLVIGGAYQGKLDYARRAFALKDADIDICTEDAEPDFSRRCLCHYERYLLRCLRTGGERRPEREDAVIVMDDIFCGVVPVEEETRAWRELAGRTMTALAQRADTVTRLFCGLPRRLKG